MKEKTKTFCEKKCQFYYSPSFVCNMRNQCPLLKRLDEWKQKLEQMLKKARAERMEHALDYPDAPASPLWERNQGKIEILEELLKEEKP